MPAIYTALMFVVVQVFLSSASASAIQTNMQTDMQSVGEFGQQWLNALQAGDWSKIKEMYTPSAVIVKDGEMISMNAVSAADFGEQLAPNKQQYTKGKVLKVIRSGDVLHALFRQRSFNVYVRMEDQRGQLKISTVVKPLDSVSTVRKLPKTGEGSQPPKTGGRSQQPKTGGGSQQLQQIADMWYAAYQRKDWTTMKDSVYTPSAVLINAAGKSPDMLAMKDIPASRLASIFPSETRTSTIISQVVEEGENVAHVVYQVTNEDGSQWDGYTRMEKNKGAWQLATDIWPLVGTSQKKLS